MPAMLPTLDRPRPSSPPMAARRKRSWCCCTGSAPTATTSSASRRTGRRFCPMPSSSRRDAPFPCDMAPFGRQWFSLQTRAPEHVLAGVRAAAPILDAFLDEALQGARARRRPARAGRVLAGHDDVALCRAAPRQAARRRSSAIPARCSAPSCWRPSCARARRCCWCMAMPIRSCRSTSLRGGGAALEAAGVAGRDACCGPGLGHGIDEEGLRAAAPSCATRLRGRT